MRFTFGRLALTLPPYGAAAWGPRRRLACSTLRPLRLVPTLIGSTRRTRMCWLRALRALGCSTCSTRLSLSRAARSAATRFHTRPPTARRSSVALAGLIRRFQSCCLPCYSCCCSRSLCWSAIGEVYSARSARADFGVPRATPFEGFFARVASSRCVKVRRPTAPRHVGRITQKRVWLRLRRVTTTADRKRIGIQRTGQAAAVLRRRLPQGRMRRSPERCSSSCWRKSVSHADDEWRCSPRGLAVSAAASTTKSSTSNRSYSPTSASRLATCRPQRTACITPCLAITRGGACTRRVRSRPMLEASRRLWA